MKIERDPLFPREITTHIPRVTLTGNDQVYVEQHMGLLAYQHEEVVFRVIHGTLTIRGQALQFRQYASTEAIVVGQIDNIIMTCRKGESSP